MALSHIREKQAEQRELKLEILHVVFDLMRARNLPTNTDNVARILEEVLKFAREKKYYG